MSESPKSMPAASGEPSPRTSGAAPASNPFSCYLEEAVFHEGAGFVIGGWLTLPASSEGLRTILLVDKVPLNGEFRFIDRADLPTAPGLQAQGFEFSVAPEDVPRILKAPVVLVIGDRHSGAVFEKRLALPRWRWEIERITDDYVKGWVVDLARPDLPALLLLRDQGNVLPISIGSHRSDVELAPGVFARDFVIRLKNKHLGSVNRPGVGDEGWLELCVGDTVNPIASLRLPTERGRQSAVGAMAERRERAHRDVLLGYQHAGAKYTNIQSASLTELARGFEAVESAPSMLKGGMRRLGNVAVGEPTVWIGPSDDRREPLAVVSVAGLSVSPLLAEVVARLGTAGADARDGWHVSNGLHPLALGAASEPTPDQGAARGGEGFAFLKPRLTPRVLRQAPDYAPLLIAPEASLADWTPADGMPSLLERLVERHGAPKIAHEALYAAARAPRTLAEDSEDRASRPAPLVSLIVPTRDNVGHLAKLLAGVARLRRRSPNVEVVIIDNNSQTDGALAFLDWLNADWIRIIPDREGFNFARLSNLGARHAQGSILLFCNDDIEIGADFDLSAMIAPLAESEVGIIGHTLVYEDGTIQHAGVVVGAYDAADNGQTAFSASEGGYFGLARLTREVSAVTAAFMAMRRSTFDQLQGFNERDFAVNFNDVDLCLRAGKAGLSILNTRQGTITHHESISRGQAIDRQERELAEVATLRRFWRTESFIDPYYSSAFYRYALPYTQPRWHRIGIDPHRLWPRNRLAPVVEPRPPRG